jgi:hypothetical protein
VCLTAGLLYDDLPVLALGAAVLIVGAYLASPRFVTATEGRLQR